MSTNFFVARAGTCKIGAVGAAEAACSDVGSVAKIGFKVTEAVNQATSYADLNAVVEEEIESRTYELTLDVQEYTAANLARSIGAAVDTDDNLIEGETISYVTGYFHGFKIGGIAKTLHVRKMRIKAETEWLADGTQQTLIQVGTVMVDPDSVDSYRIFKFLDDTADTTAPTISTVSPADEATAVAKAISTTVVVTFSEAIRSEDVNDTTFFVHDDTGAIKAGVISIGTNNTVATFTPSAAWGATTKYHVVVVKGIRDTAGNALAATSVTDFTTGA